MADSHSEGDKVGKFCTLRKAKCDCGNKYREVCKPSWAAFTFPELWQTKKGPKTVQKSYEAHHVLCVASVTGLLSAKDTIRKSLEQTTWCINTGRNLIALPEFAHTITWYGNVARLKITPNVAPPPFQNLPSHDYDHGPYQDEVEADLRGIADKVEKAGHGFSPGNLKGDLNALSSKYKSQLRARGLRVGGTHAAFLSGIADPDGLWFVPFSMAPDGVITSMSFPVRNWDDEVGGLLEKLTTAFWGAV